MMKDPKFQQDMKKFTEDPAFKDAASRATQELEVSFKIV
jgi:hypothetical protein